MKAQLGAKYRDRITGFVGICTGRADYVTGCAQVLLAPPIKEGGDLPPAHWFDDQRLERLDAPVVKLDNSETPGCDIPAPIR